MGWFELIVLSGQKRATVGNNDLSMLHSTLLRHWSQSLSLLTFAPTIHDCSICFTPQPTLSLVLTSLFPFIVLVNLLLRNLSARAEYKLLCFIQLQNFVKWTLLRVTLFSDCSSLPPESTHEGQASKQTDYRIRTWTFHGSQQTNNKCSCSLQSAEHEL